MTDSSQRSHPRGSLCLPFLRRWVTAAVVTDVVLGYKSSTSVGPEVWGSGHGSEWGRGVEECEV